MIPVGVKEVLQIRLGILEALVIQRLVLLNK
jgi:hypothetical protein